MQALGLIETRGLLAAIEAADTMVKSADVSIVEKTYIGGGLVTMVVTGDVSAVKASVEAGVASVKKLDETLLVSDHVIPRPHEELENIMGPENNPPTNSEKQPTIEDIKTVDNIETLDIKENENIEIDVKNSVIEENIDLTKTENDADNLKNLHELNLENLQKEDVDKFVRENGVEETLGMLSKVKVVKLRNLAREYKDFMIKGRAISKAGKKILINKFRSYYEKN